MLDRARCGRCDACRLRVDRARPARPGAAARRLTWRARGGERGGPEVDAVVDFLERHQAAYEVIEHRDTFAATSEARAAGMPPERMARTVLLHDHDGFRVAVIPRPSGSTCRRSPAYAGDLTPTR
jgi:hypothetical protein